MASKEDCDKYAAEMAQRFEELTNWAMTNWPHKDFPLLQSDFDASRKEIGAILGSKLGDGQTNAAVPEPAQNGPQYVDMNPAPWP